MLSTNVFIIVSLVIFYISTVHCNLWDILVKAFFNGNGQNNSGLGDFLLKTLLGDGKSNGGGTGGGSGSSSNGGLSDLVLKTLLGDGKSNQNGDDHRPQGLLSLFFGA